MHKLESLFASSQSAEDYIAGYFDRMADIMRAADKELIARLIGLVEKACAQDQTIYLIANGGSAGVASHLVNDLVPNTLVEGQPAFRAFSLTDNISSVTAIANDTGFENVFVNQLKALMRPGDLLLALSVSGNSENVIRGVQYAKSIGGTVAGLTGFDGGRLASMADLSIRFPTTRDEYGPVEDMFSLVSHIVSGYLTLKRARKLHH